MADKSDPRYKAALDFVNARRKECGLRSTSRLSKGYRQDLYSCSLANSLDKCGVTYANYGNGVVTLVGLTSQGDLREREFDGIVVTEFMRAFDAGEYPELVMDPTPIKVKKPGERKMTVIG